MEPYYSRDGIEIYVGDNRDVLPHIGPVHAVVTDPPAGIAFMGKEWDGNKGGRDQWIAWLAEILRGVSDAMLPGAHALIWALPRTSGWTSMAIEDAGLDLRDCITHLFGSGFPKSHDVSKAIDKMAGAEREVVGSNNHGTRVGAVTTGATFGGTSGGYNYGSTSDITAPATPEAEQWQGWGTALKPAAEFWYLARKPLSKPTVAAQVLATGTGAINVDASRIGLRADEDADKLSARTGGAGGTKFKMFGSSTEQRDGWDNTKGRWPSNVILDEAAAEALDAMSGERKSGAVTHRAGVPINGSWRQSEGRTDAMVRAKDSYHPASTGGASRFFYVAKASRRERNAGLEGMPERVVSQNNHGKATAGTDPVSARWATVKANHHPTVKPLALMRYLIQMVTPPGGIVLDPFMGSGSTLVAAAELGFHAIGIELSEEYAEIAARRVDYALNQKSQRLPGIN